jgi:hypothetical protein
MLALGLDLGRRNRELCVLNLVDDEGGNEEGDAWNVVDEIEGRVGVKNSDKCKREGRDEIVELDDMDPVLGELPTWSLLAGVLKKIEEEMMRAGVFGSFRPYTARALCIHHTLLTSLLTYTLSSSSSLGIYSTNIPHSTLTSLGYHHRLQLKLNKHIWGPGTSLLHPLAAHCDRRG